ncbi:MAG TPA: hypothetical protein VF285_11175 [Castellaniella sp.]|uniref:hypothetical protein n=1 Tax=Castellaniella sp. TaxID=1955812 RepID=UPI002EEA4AE4
MRQVIQVSLRAALLAAGLGCAFLLSPAAEAAGPAQSQYQRDVAHCNSTPGIDKKACLKEAGAAAQAARDNGLVNPGAQKETANRTQRCDGLTGNQRQDCMILMDNKNQVREQGSVQSGGILRETTITIPAPATNS